MNRPANELILIIDGDEDCRLMYSELLRHYGYRPVGAATGDEAVAVMGDARPAVIVVETHLPDGDGSDAAQRIARRCPAGVPIIAMSARSTRDDVDRTAHRGYTRVLLKPFRPVFLADTIAAVLRAHSSRPRDN